MIRRSGRSEQDDSPAGFGLFAVEVVQVARNEKQAMGSEQFCWILLSKEKLNIFFGRGELYESMDQMQPVAASDCCGQCLVNLLQAGQITQSPAVVVNVKAEKSAAPDCTTGVLRTASVLSSSSWSTTRSKQSPR